MCVCAGGKGVPASSLLLMEVVQIKKITAEANQYRRCRPQGYMAVWSKPLGLWSLEDQETKCFQIVTQMFLFLSQLHLLKMLFKSACNFLSHVACQLPPWWWRHYCMVRYEASVSLWTNTLVSNDAFIDWIDWLPRRTSVRDPKTSRPVTPAERGGGMWGMSNQNTFLSS